MKAIPRLLAALLVAAVLAPVPAMSARAAPSDGGPVRVLVVTGGHEYETSFYTVFEDSSLAWDHAPSNREAFREDIRSDYDVLVLYDMHQDLDADRRRNLRAFVEAGRGIVVLHHAVADYNDWEWWYRDVVGGRYVLEADDDTPGSTFQHDVVMTVRPTGSHPVTAGIGTFTIEDEAYGRMWIRPDVDVLLETDHPASDRPLAWVSPYPEARVVYVQLGHGSPAHRHPAYRRLVRQAIQWAAGRAG